MVYTHAYTYIHTHTGLTCWQYTLTHAHNHTRTLTQAHTQIHMRTYMCNHTYIHTYIHSRTQTCNPFLKIQLHTSRLIQTDTVSYIHTYIHPHYSYICPWCNGYRRRIWTRQHEFKSWTWLIAFHIALIPLGKVWIQIFSLQLWINSRAD